MNTAILHAEGLGKRYRALATFGPSPDKLAKAAGAMDRNPIPSRLE